MPKNKLNRTSDSHDRNRVTAVVCEYLQFLQEYLLMQKIQVIGPLFVSLPLKSAATPSKFSFVIFCSMYRPIPSTGY